MQQSLVVWFDIPVGDVDRAIQFYAAVLAQEIHKHEMPGFSMGVFDHSDTSVGGCIFRTEELPSGGQGPLLYFNAEGRLDEAVALVEPNGGKILQQKHSIAPHGFRAVVTDSEGNRIVLHSQSD